MTQTATRETEPVTDRRRPSAGHIRGVRRPWLAPLLVIAAELALIGWLIRDSYYASDDWIMFSIAKSHGLSWTTLGFNLYNHFAPVEWLLHVFVQDVAPLDYGAGMAIILALCAGMLLALWWTLQQLEAPRVVVVGGIVLVGTSPFLVNSAFWFGQAVFIPLFLTGIVLVVGFWVRWCRYGRPRDALATWLVFAASLLVGEIPLLVIPLLVLLRYWIVDRPGWRGLRAAIWRDRWVWVPFAALAGAFALFFRIHYYGPEPTPGFGQLFGVLAYGAVRLWRGVIGIPIAPGQAWLRILSDIGVVVTGLGALVLAARSRVVGRAVVFFALYYLLKQTALGLGLAGKYGANAVTSDAQYYIDILVVAVLAVALATSRGWLGMEGFRAPRLRSSADAPAPAGPAGDGARVRHRRIRKTQAGLVAGVLVVLGAHAVAAPFGLAHLVQGNGAATASRDYVQRLRDGLAVVDQSPLHATVVPLLLPGFVAPGFIAPYNRQDVFLRLVPEWKAYDSGPVQVVSASGALVGVGAAASTEIDPASPAVAVGNLTRRSSPYGAACFDGGAQPGTIVFTPSPAVHGAPLALDVHVRAVKPFSATAATKSEGTWTFSPVTTGTAAGDRRLVTWLPGSSAASVALASIPPFSSFCVLAVQVGVMIGAADRSGTCHSVGMDGSAGAVVPCGRRWA